MFHKTIKDMYRSNHDSVKSAFLPLYRHLQRSIDTGLEVSKLSPVWNEKTSRARVLAHRTMSDALLGF